MIMLIKYTLLLRSPDEEYEEVCLNNATPEKCEEAS